MKDQTGCSFCGVCRTAHGILMLVRMSKHWDKLLELQAETPCFTPKGKALCSAASLLIHCILLNLALLENWALCEIFQKQLSLLCRAF